ncbi:AMP-binding protein [Nocardia sp. CA2R105]|uniref:AMP-binding protein n=1 Tax=Nocardia coffeae TaxID=2873381 RepID=UPI001CA6D735|nr:AMP-binding protein [Nocardia coffeae]MBY8862893.1 AMP-binding protein [Nocardia coffeae]
MPETPFRAVDPAQPAVIVEPSGDVITYEDLETRSNQVAHLFRDRGLQAGSCVAVLVENRAEYFELVWGAQRAGLYYVGVNTHLTEAEAAYILRDSGAQLVIASDTLAPLADAILADPALAPRGRLMLGSARAGWESYEQQRSLRPRTPIPDESEGDFLLYSSGTTGRPKGIQRPLSGGPVGSHPDVPGRWLRELLDFAPGDVYLSPAPLYHAAPLAWTMSAHRSGGTVVLLHHFDPELALDAIARHQVTHSQWVPTMFVRMLKLPAQVRDEYDLSSLRHAVHAAAPCPVDIKRAMIDWWGPILFEFYSSTEGVGATTITSQEWLRKPGSVGKPIHGRPYVTDDEGTELAVGEIGTVWFADSGEFTYRGDPGKTAAAQDSRGGVSVGDTGFLDQDGYLYLTDRRTHLIISGGVNIYPREIEDVLLMHPAVADVGVVGVPDAEMGERVIAAVQLQAPATAGPDLAAELISFARTKLAGFKVPRDIRFPAHLPRTPTGKMRKHELKQLLMNS